MQSHRIYNLQYCRICNLQSCSWQWRIQLFQKDDQCRYFETLIAKSHGSAISFQVFSEHSCVKHTVIVKCSLNFNIFSVYDFLCCVQCNCHTLTESYFSSAVQINSWMNVKRTDKHRHSSSITNFVEIHNLSLWNRRLNLFNFPSVAHLQIRWR